MKPMKNPKLLRIHLDQIKENDVNLDLQVQPQTFGVLAEMEKNRECRFRSDIFINLQASRIGDLIVVKGNLRTRVEINCHRCLTEVLIPLRSDVELHYAQKESGPEADFEGDLELEADDIGLAFLSGDEIDLRDGIQEHVVMAFPLRVLCSEACKGLCPSCGADLNAGACQCVRETINPRFAALKNLKLDKKGEA